MLTVKGWEEIRRAYYIEGKNLREIVQETGRAWRTVKKMVESEEPPRYQRQGGTTVSKLGGYKERVQELLKQNKGLPRKQRWTAPRIYRQLQEEGYRGAESTVRHYVGQVRKLQKQPAVYLPLAFDPGTDAQVDWGEGDVILAGQQVTVQLFVMKLSYSRRTFMMAFPGQKQEAFFAGHVAAFDFFGGIPQRISYDNLKTAVKEVLQGRHRVEQEAFLHFRGYYLFESHFCTPGAGHEKGQVEHSVGFNRRNFLVPLPKVASFTQLNNFLHQQCLADDERQVDGQSQPIGVMWQEERSRLRPLPTRAFDCCRTTTVSLNRYSQVQLESNRYSVPTDQASSQLTAKLYPFEVKLYRSQESEPIAVHPRCYDHNQEILNPLHYLPLLRQRPGAFEHAKPVRQWRATWPAVYETLLTHLRDKWPDGRGLREFIAILYLHRDYSQSELETAIKAALAHHCAHVDGIRLWLNQQQQPIVSFPTVDLTSLPRLVAVGQQPVQAGAYDVLLGGDTCLKL